MAQQPLTVHAIFQFHYCLLRRGEKERPVAALPSCETHSRRHVLYLLASLFAGTGGVQGTKEANDGEEAFESRFHLEIWSLTSAGRSITTLCVHSSLFDSGRRAGEG